MIKRIITQSLELSTFIVVGFTLALKMFWISFALLIAGLILAGIAGEQIKKEVKHDETKEPRK